MALSRYVEIGLNIRYLNVGFVGIQFGCIHRIRVFDHYHVSRTEALTVEVL